MACPESIGDIITSALRRSANPGISAEALSFAKRLFAHLYRTHKFGFNIASTSVTVTNTNEISLSSLTTFRSTYQLTLVDIPQPIEERPYKDLSAKLIYDAAQSTTGTPRFFTCEHDRSKLLLWPRPDTSYTGTLKYYSAPSTTAWTTATFPEYESALAIEAAIADWSMNYDKEPLGILVTRLAEQLHADYVNTLEPVGNASQTQLRWGPAYNKLRGD